MGFNIPTNITPAYTTNNILEVNNPRFKRNVAPYTTQTITNCNTANQNNTAQQPVQQSRPAEIPRGTSSNPMGSFGEMLTGSGNQQVQQQLNRQAQQAVRQAQPVQQVVRPQQTAQQPRPAQPAQTVQRPVVAPPPRQIGLPQIKTKVQKGQKIDITNNGRINKVKLIIGWDIKDSRCDVDMSAFMLGDNGKCLGDEWFIFYGQPSSKDNSISYNKNTNGANSYEKAIVNIDFNRVDSRISKLAVVLTIDEALTNKLNFSMLANTYLKIVDASNNNEICTFVLNDYYKEVTSMVLGEVYKHKDTWKFNCIGNGVAKDLAGLCEMYGIETE
jgi:stress response protein SCP2